MHYCVQFGNAVVMRILLDKGASMDIKNSSVSVKCVTLKFEPHQELDNWTVENVPTSVGKRSTWSDFKKSEPDRFISDFF